MSASPESSGFPLPFETAVKEYETQTRISLIEHPLAKKLEKCDSVLSVTRVLQDQLQAFRRSDGKVIDSLKRVVHILHALSTCVFLDGSIGLAPFSSAKIVLAGTCILLTEIEDVSATYDALVDLFESLEKFLTPLDIYAEFPPTRALTKIVEEIMVELLRTLTLATQQVKQGQLKMFRVKLLGEIDIEAVSQRLDILAQDEARATAAQILEVVYGLIRMMRAIMDDTNASIGCVRDTRVMVEHFMNKTKCDQLQYDIRKWLSPPDPRKNHNIACEAHHSGTASWFIEGNAFAEWKSSGSLLWIHGRPGSGKSVLCSTIIQNIDCVCKSGLASLALFYCDFRDDQKQDRRGLISSVLVQLCAQSESYSNILSDFYSAHGRGSHHASDGELEKCLEDLLKLPGQPPIYIIVDGLDECPKSSGMSSREKVLTLVEKLVGLALPNLRICVTSRLEADIEAALRPLTPRSVSLHEERGQRQDVLDYVTSVVNLDPGMRRWRAEDKERVIEVLSRKADGTFRWASCQLDVLRHCLPAGIRRALDELPGTLDETYERTLRDIGEQNWEYAHRIFQCITVACRPLRVEELAEFFAFDFGAGQIPTFLPDWRPDDPRNAVLSTCSSLITIVKVNRSFVIQFSHFSVKEFLTSSRLATARDGVLRRYYIPMMPAHTIVARACLGILLYLDDKIRGENLKHFPLAEYAARHWVDHAKFVNVSSGIQDGMRLLFDPRKPHFSVWVWIYDPDTRWIQFQRSKSLSQPGGSPLHYAALYGLRDVAEFLIIEHSQDVNTRSGSRNVTPLSVASDKGHLNVIRLLLEHRANPNVWDDSYKTPLHGVSQRGHVEIARVLLEYGADPNVRGIGDSTPLRLALKAGHVEVVRVLLEHGAIANTWDHLNRTPLHQASREGHVDIAQVLLDHGADTNSRDRSNWTPLHWASQGGHVQVARLLFEHGADANAQAFGYSTPLHWALREGHLEMVRFLLDHGACFRDYDNSLHWASRCGHLGVASFLLEHGADPNSRGNSRETPLHQASQGGHLEVAQVLLEHRVDPNSRDSNNETPLHQASQRGHLDVARFLLEHGARPNSRNSNKVTSLLRASQQTHLDIARVLPLRLLDPNPQVFNIETPLHRASQQGYLDVTRVLLEHGADPISRNFNKETPLHRASQGGHLEIARVLLVHGARPNSRNSDNETPLHQASERGHLNVARVLLEHGARPNSRNSNNETPLHRASQGGHLDVTRVLLEHGARPNSWNSNKAITLDRASQRARLYIARVLPLHLLDPNPRVFNIIETPLHRASQHGHLDLARVLLEHGARPNPQDSNNETPLHRASQLDVARVLLEHGADPNFRDFNGQTLLHQASQEGRLDVTRVLLEHGADPISRNSNKETPLHRASQYGHLEIARVLLEHGADPISRDFINETPLHQALHEHLAVSEVSLEVLQQGHLEVARVLLEHGADPNARVFNNETLLHRASQQGCLDVARVLLEHGADPNSRDSKNETPLHRVSQGGHLDVARVLLEHGADPNSQKFDDQTPLHRASQHGYLEVTRVLLEHGADPNGSPVSNSVRWTSERRRPGVAWIFFASCAHTSALHDARSTPLHLASQSGSLEVARLLLEYGADVNARNGKNKRPLDKASNVEMRNLLASFSCKAADEDASGSGDRNWKC